MGKTRKVTVYILDDEPASAVARAAAFFEYTQAPMLATSTDEALQRLGDTEKHPGVVLRYLTPSEFLALSPSSLCHGVALIDCNWSNYRGTDSELVSLPADKLTSFGVTLAERAIDQRPPESHFHIVLYSATRGDHVSAAFTEWTVLQHHPYVWQVVSGERTADEPTIRRYARLIFEDISGDILTAAAPEVRDQLRRARETHETSCATLRLESFAGLPANTTVDGFLLTDLAVPYLKRYVARLGTTPSECWHALGSEILAEWAGRFGDTEIAFEFEAAPTNLAILFVQALLRYGRIEPLDGLLLFQQAGRSRFANPVESLKEYLATGATDGGAASLRQAFSRIPQIKLGTEMDASEQKRAALPRAMRDRAVFDVERLRTRGKSPPQIQIRRSGKEGDPAFTLQVSDGVRVRNRLWRVQAYCAALRRGKADPQTLPEMFAADPDNLDLLELIADDLDTALSTSKDSLVTASQFAAQLDKWACAHDRAIAVLRAYSEFLRAMDGTKAGKVRRSLLPDLVGFQAKLGAWAKRARLFREAARKLGVTGDSEQELYVACVRFFEADSFEQHQIIFRRTLKRIAEASLHTAIAAIKARAQAWSIDRTYVSQLHETVAQHFPLRDDRLRDVSLMEAILDSKAAVRAELAKSAAQPLEARISVLITKSIASRLAPDGLPLPYPPVGYDAGDT